MSVLRGMDVRVAIVLYLLDLGQAYISGISRVEIIVG